MADATNRTEEETEALTDAPGAELTAEEVEALLAAYDADPYDGLSFCSVGE